MTRSCFIILTLCCIFLAGCSKISEPQVKLPPLKIGAGVYTETIIIAEMAKLLAERNRGYATEIILSIPSSRVMHQGRINGEIDLSIAFTGTELSGPLAPSPAFHDRTAALQYMTEEFSRRFKQKVIGPLGFENTYAIAVRQDTAVAHDVAQQGFRKAIRKIILCLGIKIPFQRMHHDIHNTAGGLIGRQGEGQFRVHDGKLRAHAVIMETYLIQAFFVRNDEGITHFTA